MIPFSQLPAVKKDSKNGAARKFFGTFYFVTTLDNMRAACMRDSCINRGVFRILILRVLSVNIIFPLPVLNTPLIKNEHIHLPFTMYIYVYVSSPMSLAHIDLRIDYVILALGLIIHSTTMSIVWWSYKFDGKRGCL